MKILLAGKKERARSCLEAVRTAGHTIVGLIGHPGKIEEDPFLKLASQTGTPLYQPENPNDPTFLADLRKLSPEITILAGYGKIVKKEFLKLSPRGCLNLHGGKLPQYRGSSPLNWALIRGEKEATLSIIEVDEGIDTGDVYAEKSFPISEDDTIADLHRRANELFPEMLVGLLETIERGKTKKRRQNEDEAGYFPLRFADDGLIVWDQMTAEEVHNRIRALTTPYPGAFSYFKGEKVKLLRSSLEKSRYYGEPGRIYQINDQGFLIAAKDRCLWVLETEPKVTAKRYDKFLTLKDKLLGTSACHQ